MDIREMIRELREERHPYHRDMFPMDDEKKVVEAIPDPHLRTCVSGYLMRWGWELCLKEIEKRLNEEEEDE